MTFDEIQKEAEKDLVFDSTELDKEALRIPQLHNKYLNFFSGVKLIVRKLEQDYDSMRKIKWEYYTGKMSQEELTSRGWEPFQFKILKQDLDIYMNSDKDLQKILMSLEAQKMKLEYLEGILKGIMNRHWMIRSSIDWRRFVNGVS